MHNLSFSYGWVLFLILPIVAIMILFLRKDNQHFASIKYSYFGQVSQFKSSYKTRLRLLPDILTVLSVVLILIGLARPHFSLSKDDKDIEGIDLILSLDVSPSMLAEDFKPNRLVCAKNVAIDFVDNRPNDQIGLVVFSGESFTQCPPTIDHKVLLTLINSTQCGNLEDGTAIGEGLATAINRLQNSKAKSKVIILLTDGVNNSGQIDPLQAALIAKDYNIKIYTIGVGSKGMAPYPVQTATGIKYEQMKVEIDEDLLSKIATSTGGQYFRSEKDSSLKEIFEQIDTLEKTAIKVSIYNQTKDTGDKLAFLGLMIFVIENILRYFLLKRKY